jgi:peptidoglycan L-alanyl-D-glutamate endopeptidase CwlK
MNALLAAFVEAGLPVLIINTLRTQAEQDANLANGTSWVQRSAHQDGLAIDVCPYEQYVLHGENKLQWDVTDPVWKRLGVIGEALGLRWGGRFRPPAKPDLGHFEYIEGGGP